MNRKIKWNRAMTAIMKALDDDIGDLVGDTASLSVTVVPDPIGHWMIVSVTFNAMEPKDAA
jgi:hypothetical protein